MKSSIRFLFPILFLLLMGAGGCTRTRPPQTFPESLVTLPAPTPAPVTLPRFTPHVTSVVPTATPFVLPATPASPLPPPQSAPPPSPHPTPRIHVVQPHETLLDIAAHYQVSLEALARANHITDPTTIKPGDELIIP